MTTLIPAVAPQKVTCPLARAAIAEAPQIAVPTPMSWRAMRSSCNVRPTTGARTVSYTPLTQPTIYSV